MRVLTSRLALGRPRVRFGLCTGGYSPGAATASSVVRSRLRWRLWQYRLRRLWWLWLWRLRRLRRLQRLQQRRHGLENCCCDSGGQVMHTGITPNRAMAGSSRALVASMYFPSQGYSYAASRCHSGTEASTSSRVIRKVGNSGSVPAGGIVPGQLPTRPVPDGTSGDNTRTRPKARRSRSPMTPSSRTMSTSRLAPP